MKPTDLDRSFDQALERTGKKKPIRHQHGVDVLASDHFLLTKGWRYFTERVRDIESQWQAIVSAKDEEIKALDDKAQILESQMLEIHDRNQALESFETLVTEARRDDFVQTDRDIDKLKLAWEEERQVLDEKCGFLEFKLKESSEMFEKRESALHLRESQLLKEIEKLKADSSQFVEGQLRAQKGHAELLSGKDREIHNLDLKVELLQGEIERRDQMLKEEDRTNKTVLDEVRVARQRIDELMTTVESRDRAIQNLELKLEILRKENDGIRAGRATEQAQWRELWDRAVETWEHQKRNFQSINDKKDDEI